jgi:pimeloyl-ACP methyl ester carboxylesterase
VLDALVAQADASPEQFDIVGHSLGGVLALAIAQRSKMVRRVVTLSAPFGGSQVASIMRWFAPGSILQDIHPQSDLLRRVRQDVDLLEADVLAVVTYGGTNPLMTGENDGVITVESQMAICGIRMTQRPVNHFEVLLDLDTAHLIEEHLW